LSFVSELKNLNLKPNNQKQSTNSYTMKKLLALIMLAGVITIGFSSVASADVAMSADVAVLDQDVFGNEVAVDDRSFHQVVKEKFIEGGWQFMGIVLVCLILGLAIAIERIITLNLATSNNKKLLAKVEEALKSGGVEAAKEVTKSTRGPVASIFTQGLMRMSEGLEMVEKSIIAYGSVEMGRLERGLVWISLFISLAPMLGFMGTVIGMIEAFDSIEAAGDISPALVARGIKIALLTTVAGLIVAVILQLFYNYLVAKIDSLVNSMEDASISLVDILVRHNLSK
jgi:biopolymer transport protein ExbB